VNTTITHVVVHGRVQGVGYRAFVEHEAGQLGLQGFVRNRRDGTVEALFVGSAEAIRTMIDRCRKGPPGARVDRIDQREGSADELALRGKSEPFAVLPTV
jgi:acylphosphatase